MNRLTIYLSSLLFGAFVFSCQQTAKDTPVANSDNEIPAAVTAQVKKLGFSTENMKRIPEGYLVEGDIILDEEALEHSHGKQEHFLRVGSEEQYRTSALVGGLPRTITISLSSSLPSVYTSAVDELIRRYNNEGLQVRFSRVSSGGAIQFGAAPSGSEYLASAGFPSNGNPYNRVLVNVSYLGSSSGTTRVNYLATIFAHEVGHCIGFRHTDYYNRAISCGGAASNEGSSGIGAILIPGTPSSADLSSWMLACVGNNQNRPFTTNDRTALRYLY
ncbi:M57 family metalloprotease [Fibrella aquatica]|jgi:Dual-action HEIGH metallo-peptidase|uniref:M57 family metalloprotease n=1 Tax=Fibrella aquatica TaxID=3242487 RepID=UPI0035228CF1